MYVDAMVSYEHKRCIKASSNEEANQPILKEPTYPVRKIDLDKLLLPKKSRIQLTSTRQMSKVTGTVPERMSLKERSY